jgi:membrane-bound ClpP family serine protease
VIDMWDFILSNLPILLCALAGMALIVVEVFMPGFGLPGVSGIVLLGAAVFLTLKNYGGMAALGITIVIIAALAILVTVSLKSVSRGTLSKTAFVLRNTTSSEEGFDSVADMREFLGRRGETRTILRPVGVAEFDGVRLDVVTEGEYIGKERPVVIVRVEGSRIVVRQAGEQGDTEATGESSVDG